ncbi:MAG: glycosyltransferase family 4 protein [Aquabacterium sp.]|uniref:glycosyltransferase family 4 protein n=1 Tax=Aquabacterium sp. TaxID=1872578 RepID=UPI0025B91483|nr:glycosyltransferase family 4 protein [Aquabacterium sp.]MBI5925020.1 glycosyltransferase family 4 protein [Aquabacterium sp.]
MLTIYHFLLDHRIGGPHVYVDMLREALAGQSSAVVLTSGKGPLTELALFNLRHWWAPLYLFEVVANVVLIISLVWRKKIRTEDAIFHVHGGGNVAPLIAARLLGVPVLWQLHETTTAFRKLVLIGMRLLRGTKHQVATVASKAISVYGIRNAVLLPGAVDLDFWRRAQISQAQLNAAAWHVSPSALNDGRILRVLTVGNLNPLKGQDLLLKAMQAYGAPFHLKIVGAELATHSGYANQLRQLALEAERAGADRRVEFMGWRDKEEVRALMASSDIFVMPSRSEACPLVLLEALAMGCACIASDVGDVQAMMAVADQARVVEAESIDALREALIELSTATSALASTSAREGEQVPPQWQLTRLAAESARIYRELAQDHGH